MPSAGFEPAIPATNRPQKYVLDSHATVTVIVPTVTCINTCPSARKEDGNIDEMQTFATLCSVVGDH
jgi:hypothetical protein